MMKWKRGIALGLAVALTVGMTACNTAKSSDETSQGIQGTKISSDGTTPQEQVDLSYQSKFTTLASKEDGISHVRIEGDKIYEISVEAGSAGTLWEQTCSAGEAGDRNQLMKFNARGAIELFFVDASGNLYLVMADSQNGENEDAYAGTKSYRLTKFDVNGNLAYEQMIDQGDQDVFYPGYLVADGKGRTYLGSMDAVFRFDEEGRQKGSVFASKSRFSGFCLNQNDNLYCVNVQYEDNDDVQLLEYAFESEQPVNAYKNFINVDGPGVVEAGDLLYAISSGSICTYSIKNEGIINQITLLNCGIETNSVVSFGMVGEEFYLALCDSQSAVWPKQSQQNEYELACIGRSDSSEVQQKQVITFGAPIVGSVLQERILELNKKSDKYRIVVKTYYSEAEGFKEGGFEEAVERFRMDVMTGNCPDIIDFHFLDPGPLFDKGVMEDLYPWLEKSERISKDFFVDGILDKMAWHGKLYCIQDGFSLDTMIGKTNVVGSKSGWSVSDLLAAAKEHPGMKLMDGYTKSMFLEAMLSMNTDQYIDFATGTCHFDSSEFKAVLELAGKLEDEIKYEGLVSDGTADRMHGEKTMLCPYRIANFSDYAIMELLYGEGEFTNVGYPSGKGNGCLILTAGGVGISALSDHKEAAWAFMEDYIMLLDEEQESYAFPVTRGKYERDKEYASEFHYLTDENGEVMLDGRGNPIKRPGGPAAITDGMVLDPDPLTEQQAKKIENLIKNGISTYEMMDDEIFKIIEEEAQSYFAGAKSVDEVADVIQKRVSLYVMEN